MKKHGSQRFYTFLPIFESNGLVKTYLSKIRWILEIPSYRIYSFSN